MKKKNKKVVIGMSGGVDSSVSAFLLQKQGYEVIGMFMRLFGGQKEVESENSARRVCQKLGIKFYPINFAGEFKKEIIDYFLDSYAQGATPNPCVRCNKVIKFDLMLRQARKFSADYLATGHYARITNYELRITNYKYRLFCGADKSKDQSYFLYNLTQGQLAYILFPLGDYTKEKIREIADKEKLPYLLRESQDICFLSGDHNDFLKKYLKLKPGLIKILDNEEVGRHQGLPLYTIGQRRGIEIGGIGPFYAAKCDYRTNTLFVVSDRDDKILYKDELNAEDVNWISGEKPSLPIECEAVIRYRHKPVKCQITKLSNNLITVKFSKPQRAVTSGQSIVFYDGREVLGGGVIV